MAGVGAARYWGQSAKHVLSAFWPAAPQLQYAWVLVRGLHASRMQLAVRRRNAVEHTPCSHVLGFSSRIMRRAEHLRKQPRRDYSS